VPNSRIDPNYSDLKAAERVGAYAGFTIHDDRGEMFGVLCGARPEPLESDEVIDEELVHLFSDLLSAQLELARRADRGRRDAEIAEARAHSDVLTGLLNRRGWDRVMDEAQERLDGFGDAAAIVMIDLDGLKSVNDTDGHLEGDRLLSRAATAIREACPPGSHAARFGGDEFGVLVSGVV